jgi:hypothetical protein
MARRYEFFQESTGRDWICFDMKLGREEKKFWHTAIVYPYREANSRNDVIRADYKERDGICGFDPCFPGSVRPYSPVRRKDIPKDVLSRLEFPKKANEKVPAK